MNRQINGVMPSWNVKSSKIKQVVINEKKKKKKNVFWLCFKMVSHPKPALSTC
jgi:hypothetical protein